MKQADPRIVVIGGGAGSFTLLGAFKQYTSQLTALVNMADNGGSTGVLRDELGVLPPGDIRQCLVALSNAPQEVRELFNFRFPGKGSLGGHSFGNLFLSAVETMTTNFNDAIRMAGEVLNISGSVLPLTLDKCTLVLKNDDQEIHGQREIELTTLQPNAKLDLWLVPPAQLNPEAKQAILQADLIVIAPGNLYAFLIPALLVSGLPAALHASSAPLAYVCNLVNKANHTENFAVHDYVRELERFIGSGTIDYVLYNTRPPSAAILNRYALAGEHPVRVDKCGLLELSLKSVGGDFLARRLPTGRNPNDSFIERSLIRHDPEAIDSALIELIS